MGCISSKLAAAADLRRERKLLCGAGAGASIVVDSGAGDYPNHVVSLISSTYGVLKLDRDDAGEEGGSSEECCRRQPLLLVTGFPKREVSLGEPEVINAWELMEDIDDDIAMYSPVKKATAQAGARIKSFECVMESPRKQKKCIAGKENLHGAAVSTERADVDPGRVLKPLSSGLSKDQQRATPVTAVRFKSTPVNLKIQASGRDPLFSEPSKSVSPAPLFDPDLLASFEREHCEEEGEIKKMVSSAPRIWKASTDAAASLQVSLDRCCPPGGEDAVVLYTTTLRGIRRTFEECNAVRAAVEAHGVQVTERDVSMDAGFREELRKLMGGDWKGARRVPVLFVRGRLVGGAEEVLQLQDGGKLGAMVAGIPMAAPWCDGCGGIRFVMCMDCSGSRKVFDEGEKKVVMCGECNENGLIHCPICC